MGQFTNGWRMRVRRLEYLIARAIRGAETVLGNAWLQGGNSFGATGVLGTNDANPLNVVTNGVTRYSLDTSGNLISLRGFVGWSATSPPTAAGQLGMNVTTGRGTLFVNGIVQQIAVLGDLPGGGAPTFPATLTNTSAQYTALPTDRLIEVDVSGGQLTAPLLFEANPVAGNTHTVKVVNGDPAANPVNINGNGRNIEDPNALGTFSGGTVAIKTASGTGGAGSAVTWIFDGQGRWVVTASA